MNCSMNVPTWLQSVEGPILEQPVAANGRVFAAASGDRAMAVEAVTGDEAWKWRPRTPSRISSGLTVFEGMAFVGDDRGFVYALQADDSGAMTGKRMLQSCITGQPRVIGEPDVNVLPEALCRVTRVPDKKAIREALERGDLIPGCVLSNAIPTLMIRVK